MEKILINGEKYVTGNINFCPNSSFLDLKIGEKFISIGDTKSKSSFSRHDSFKEPVAFAGVLEIENLKFLAFHIPKTAIVGEFIGEMYKLYNIGTNKIYVPNDNDLTIRIYKPIFVRA